MRRHILVAASERNVIHTHNTCALHFTASSSTQRVQANGLQRASDGQDGGRGSATSEAERGNDSAVKHKLCLMSGTHVDQENTVTKLKIRKILFYCYVPPMGALKTTNELYDRFYRTSFIKGF